MAGPLTIQRVPKGLLHALSMKGSGSLPTNLAEAIIGTFDAKHLYLLDNIRSIFGNTAGLATNSYYQIAGAGTTVPAGEIWLLSNFSAIKLGIGAGTNFTVTLGYARKFANSSSLLPAQQIVPVNGDVMLGYEWPVEEATILQPGDSVGIYTSGGTYGTNPPIQLSVNYYRLEI